VADFRDLQLRLRLNLDRLRSDLTGSEIGRDLALDVPRGKLGLICLDQSEMTGPPRKERIAIHIRIAFSVSEAGR